MSTELLYAAFVFFGILFLAAAATIAWRSRIFLDSKGDDSWGLALAVLSIVIAFFFAIVGVLFLSGAWTMAHPPTTSRTAPAFRSEPFFFAYFLAKVIL